MSDWEGYDERWSPAPARPGFGRRAWDVVRRKWRRWLAVVAIVFGLAEGMLLIEEERAQTCFLEAATRQNLLAMEIAYDPRSLTPEMVSAAAVRC